MCTVVCVACEYGECDGNAGVGDGGGVVVMSARHECELCKCLARGGVGDEWGEWIRGLDLGFTNPVRTEGVLDGCVWVAVVWCRWGVGRGIGPGSGRVVLCLCVL